MPSFCIQESEHLILPPRELPSDGADDLGIVFFLPDSKKFITNSLV